VSRVERATAMPSSFLRPHASTWELRIAYVVAILGSLAIAVLFMGVYPLPFTEVMHASVNELLRHVSVANL